MNGPADGARTYAFVTLICAELFRAYGSRSEHQSVFSMGLFANKAMLRATGISLLMLLVVIYVPFLDPVFRDHFPGAAGLGRSAAAGAGAPLPRAKCLRRCTIRKRHR